MPKAEPARCLVLVLVDAHLAIGLITTHLAFCLKNYLVQRNIIDFSHYLETETDSFLGRFLFMQSFFPPQIRVDTAPVVTNLPDNYKFNRISDNYP